MTWLTWLKVGRQLVECAVHLIAGETCEFTFSWRGVQYAVSVKRA